LPNKSDAGYRYSKKPIMSYSTTSKQMPKNVVQMTPSFLNTLTREVHHILLQSNTYEYLGYPASSRRSMDKIYPSINFFYGHPSQLGSGVRGPEKSKRIWSAFEPF
jgi:hypothetical protein